MIEMGIDYTPLEDGYGLNLPTHIPLDFDWDCSYEGIRIEGGVLYIEAGTWWNGSNVVADHPRAIRGALYHDCLYRLMKIGVLPTKYRKNADSLYRKTLIEDGFSKWKAWIRWATLRAVWTWKDRGW